MKKMITSAGCAVLGAATLQAQYAPAPQLTRLETAKPWSVAASLRGFYDDNYTTRPSNSGFDEESFGIEVSPSVGLNWVLPQTYLGLSYVYGMRWYEDRENNSADHSHQANLKLSHAFTERYKLDVSDSFVVAQEPELIAERGTALQRFLRTEGDNIRNTANATLTAGLTEQLSTVLGYSNSMFDYDQEDSNSPTTLDPRGTSLSSLLDRWEHLITANLRYQLVPSTVGVLGYQYGDVEYDNNNWLTIGVPSAVRNNYSHYVYAGVDHEFNPQLSASIRGGAQFTEYDNGRLNTLFPNADDSVVNPFVDANANWSYGPRNYIQLGVRHARQATDLALFNVNSPTLDQEATTVYGSWNHEVMARLTSSLLAQYQRASFEGGPADDESEHFLLAGVNFSYQINQFLAAETGYNFDRLDSDINGRSFTRNRVYVGVRATY